MDVFAVYIEMTRTSATTPIKGYGEHEAAATVAIARNEDGTLRGVRRQLVERDDGQSLVRSIQAIANLDKAALKAAYKGAATPPARQQLRQRSRSRPAGHRPQVQRTTGRIAEGTPDGRASSACAP